MKKEKQIIRLHNVRGFEACLNAHGQNRLVGPCIAPDEGVKQ